MPRPTSFPSRAAVLAPAREDGGAGLPPPPPGDEGADEADRRRKAFLLRVSPQLMAELRTWAAVEFRSLNAHIEYLLAEALRRRRGE